MKLMVLRSNRRASRLLRRWVWALVFMRISNHRLKSCRQGTYLHLRVGTGGGGPKNTRFRKVIEKNFTQRRKDRKDAKAGQMLQARLCVFAIFASLREQNSRLHAAIRFVAHFLNRLANAWRASVGAPDEVCRSTTVRGTNNSQVLRAFLLTMRAGIDLLHWKCALGSKYVHWRHV